MRLSQPTQETGDRDVLPAAGLVEGVRLIETLTIARSGASTRNRLLIIVAPSSDVSGPDMTMTTPYALGSATKALWAS